MGMFPILFCGLGGAGRRHLIPGKASGEEMALPKWESEKLGVSETIKIGSVLLDNSPKQSIFMYFHSQNKEKNHLLTSGIKSVAFFVG